MLIQPEGFQTLRNVCVVERRAPEFIERIAEIRDGYPARLRQASEILARAVPLAPDGVRAFKPLNDRKS